MTAPAPPPIRILGIDPGLRSTGFGVIDKIGNKLAYVASGCIKTDAAGSLPERIKTILDGLVEIIATYRPQQAAVEIVFVNVNPQSTLLLGQARGAAIAALVTADLALVAGEDGDGEGAALVHDEEGSGQRSAWRRRRLKG